MRRPEGKERQNQSEDLAKFSEEPIFNLRPIMTKRSSACSSLSGEKKGCPPDATVCGETWGPGAGTDGARGESEDVRGRAPDTVGPWDFVFYPKL